MSNSHLMLRAEGPAGLLLKLSTYLYKLYLLKLCRVSGKEGKELEHSTNHSQLSSKNVLRNICVAGLPLTRGVGGLLQKCIGTLKIPQKFLVLKPDISIDQ